MQSLQLSGHFTFPVWQRSACGQRGPDNRGCTVVNSNWSALVSELESRVPLLFEAFSSIAAHSNHCNKSKVGAAHHPGICMAAAVILKERNREMCGVQSVLSLLMYSCHCEKKIQCEPHHKTALACNRMTVQCEFNQLPIIIRPIDAHYQLGYAASI